MSETDGSEAFEMRPDGDRRRFKRVAVSLPGRYMLEDGSEHPCVCIDISVGGLRLRGAQAGPWGSRVIAYIDGVGRIEGYIVRRAVGWFALECRISARKGERVQERISVITDADCAEPIDRRSDLREHVDRQAYLTTRDGRRHVAQITDINREGAALLTEAQPEVDERVRLESRRAIVVRLFPGGLALRFERAEPEARPLPESEARSLPEPAKLYVAPRARRA